MKIFPRFAFLIIGFVSLTAWAEVTNPVPATFHDCKGCPEMVVVPPGINWVGLGRNGAHEVTISKSFALSKTEVTQAQWRAVMGKNPSGFSQCGENCPVETVSWSDVQLFIEKLNAKTGKVYRLPSESEWEYACRAGELDKYCGSHDADDVAWQAGNSSQTHPVASKQANAWGLYDMSGNVYEWVADRWHKSISDLPTDGSAWQSGDESYHVVRGGAYNDSSRHVESRQRNYYRTDYRGSSIGFRLAKSDATPVSNDKPLVDDSLDSRDVPADITSPVAKKLRELQVLKNEGVLTQDEYLKKKKQLLDQF